jgi:hypothetical protein
MDERIPILNRTYFPYADLDVHYNILRIERIILVDLRTLTIADPEDPPCEAQRGVFSVLAPRNAPYGLVFPGILWPNQFGPTDFPLISVQTLGEQLEQLRQARLKVTMFLERVRHMLTSWQLQELDSSRISLFTLKGRHLMPCQVNRDMFFRIIHPTFNPLLTRREATFLRGACYALRAFRFEQVAEAVDILLRTPQLDEHLCRELLAHRCLEVEERMGEAKRILEQYEGLAEGDCYAGPTAGQ